MRDLNKHRFRVHCKFSSSRVQTALVQELGVKVGTERRPLSGALLGQDSLVALPSPSLCFLSSFLGLED